MKRYRECAFLCPVILGVALLLVGCFMKMPGTALTTVKSVDGNTCTSDYYIGDRYSAIDEYVGGDAYNYIIGSALVAGRISGTIMAKTLCVVAGALCICAGATMWMLTTKKMLAEAQGGQAAPAICTPDLNGETAPSSSRELRTRPD